MSHGDHHPAQPQVKKGHGEGEEEIPCMRRPRCSALSPRQIPALQSRLEALLPFSVPLLRRIQFHLGHQPVSESARIYVAVAGGAGGGDGDDDDSADVDRWLRSSDGRAQHGGEEEELPRPPPSPPAELQDSRPWIAAHIDLANPGQCQVWMFASWEADPRYPFPSSVAASSTASASTSVSVSASSSSSSPSPSSPPPRPAIHGALVRALFTYIRTDLVPLRPTAPPPASWLELLRAGKYLTTPYSRDKVLFGTVSEKLWRYFPLDARARTDDGYWKYLFRVGQEGGDEGAEEGGLPSSVSKSTLPAHLPPIIPSSAASSTTSLPPNYHFGPLRASHLQTVLDRTPVPRTLATLRDYVSLGVFFHRHGEDRQPDPDRPAVAWGFLGKDASLSSLHTEPEHRGKGLAVALGRELLRRQHVASPRLAAAPEKTGKETLGNDRDGDGQGARHTAATNGDGTRRGGWDPHAPTDSANATPRYTWAHADVSQSNTASRRVMEKLGGAPLWMVMWTEVDIEKVLSSSLLPS